MTELLPGPEDAGKHLFEISPGRREYLPALCGGLVVVTPVGGVTAPLAQKGRPLSGCSPVGTSPLSPRTTQKFGPNLGTVANLGEY